MKYNPIYTFENLPKGYKKAFLVTGADEHSYKIVNLDGEYIKNCRLSDRYRANLVGYLNKNKGKITILKTRYSKLPRGTTISLKEWKKLAFIENL